MPRKPSTRKRKVVEKEDKVMNVMAKNIKPNDVLLYPASRFQHQARELEVEKIEVCHDYVTAIVRRSAVGLHVGLHMGKPTTRHHIRRPA